MTVAELGDRMSSRELSEWMAYYSIEPFGEERSDLRAGIVASTVANVHISKASQRMKPSDFMIQFDKDPEAETTPTDLAAKFDAALGGI